MPNASESRSARLSFANDEQATSPRQRLANIWYVVWAYALPWSSPILLRIASRGNEAAELLAFLAWPFLFLVIGMYIGTLRHTHIPPGASDPAKFDIATYNSKFSNRYNLGIFFLALFECAAVVALSDNVPFEPFRSYAFLTATLFAPFVVLTTLAEKELLKGRLIAIDVSEGAEKAETASKLAG